jgi:hypothetical protein
MVAIDWNKIEQVLDDTTAAHSCAFCGVRIPVGDASRWGLAIRRPSGKTSVVWCHPECVVSQMTPLVRRAYEGDGPAAPPT